MATSVSCQPCCSPVVPVSSCLFKLPGECGYYSGPNIPVAGVNTGDNLNIVISKLVNYIGSITGALPPIDITSTDFFDAVTYKNPSLDNVPFMLFWNQLQRFLKLNVDFTAAVGGGFVITIPGFNATQNSYDFELFPK